MWQTVMREQLYEQVGSVPLSQLCERYGLSDNGLRKACKRLNVPIPWRGYWAKVEAEHKVKQTPLPLVAKLRATEIWTEPKRERTEADDTDATWLTARAAFEADPAHAIEVVMKPRRWHAVIAPLKQVLEAEERKIEAARKATEQYEKWPEWRKQRESGPDRMAWLWYERAQQLMHATHLASVVRLSLAQFRRGLAVLNAVALVATKRGFEVRYDDQKGRVVLNGHGGEIELRMSEKTEQKIRKVKRYDGKMEDERFRVPTGRLRLYAERGYGKVWTFEESAAKSLESQLNTFFTGLWKQVVLCRQKTRDEEECERRAAVLAAERAEVERREREEEARREAERQRRVSLIKEARAWPRASLLREYVAAVSVEAASRNENVEVRLSEWTAWALGVSDGMDPVWRRVDPRGPNATL